MNYPQRIKNYQVTFVWNAVVLVIVDTVDVGYNVVGIKICHNV